MHYIGLSIGGMIGQAFAIEHGAKLISALWSDTLPSSPAGAAALWDERMNTVRRANSLEPLADGTAERWFTRRVQAEKTRPLEAVPRHRRGNNPGRISRLLGGDHELRLHGSAPGAALPTLVVCGADDPGTPASENRRLAGLVPGGRYEEIAGARHFPNVELPRRLTGS